MLTKWQHIKQSVFFKNKQSVLQSVFPFPQYIMESIRANHSHPGMILIPGCLANSGDNLDCYNWWAHGTDIREEETRDVAEHPTM